MAEYRNVFCDDEARRAKISKHPTLNGIDYIEVVTEPPAVNQPVLQVFFIAKTTPEGRTNLSEMLDKLHGAIDKIEIEGGTRIRNIRVTNVKKCGDDHLEVYVTEPGDFSTYTLNIKYVWTPGDEQVQQPPPKLDPAYAQCDFSFKAACPSRFDCKPRLVCPIEPRVEPLIDYMAKDYASFRQALLDLIPTLLPGWKERHEADLGITLVELLAYVGDYLSYYQDAVANEAYLETARQRLSVRRHARLIDYRMHDGASARAFVHFQLDKGAEGILPEGTQLLTRINVPLRSKPPPHDPVIETDLAEDALTATAAVFETMNSLPIHGELKGVPLHEKLNRIEIHTWGNSECCLPRGTTTADLHEDLAFDPQLDMPDGTRQETWRLKRGDFLLFEEVKGPQNGEPADADPTHRQVVRLIKVEKIEDPLPEPETGGSPVTLTRVTWDIADALAFPLCLSARLTDGTDVDDVSVARGNLVLADHGRTVNEWHPGDPADPRVPGIQTSQRAYRFRLGDGPLSFRIPMPKENGSLTPAKELLTTDPRQAEPQVTRLVVTSTTPSDDWKPVVPHLLDSDPFDHHFAVETDNDGRAVIRFGDGVYGMPPPDGAHIQAIYRVGVGTEGNVGPESLIHIVKKDSLPNIVSLLNPLPAQGGIDPQPVEQVKYLAPSAFHAELLRAVTEADYACAAEKHREVSRAVATFRWTGSWHTVFVTIDPRGRTDVPHDLKERIRDWVTRYAQAGYDLEINSPIYVPLEIEIDMCVAPDHFRAHVEEALLRVLSNRTSPDGTRGFFHPDNFTFGQPLYLSRLYAEVESIEGVDSAVVTKFQRFGKAPNKELQQGYIPAGRLEVVRLDNDLSFPENGVLRLNMLGGK